eukprot:sb/3477436/
MDLRLIAFSVRIGSGQCSDSVSREGSCLGLYQYKTAVSTSIRNYRVFILDLYKRWALFRKKLSRLGHEISYLDYSEPSFKVPGVFGPLAPRKVCFWHQNYQKEFFCWF